MYRRSIAVLAMCLTAFLAMPVLAQADTGNIIEPQNEPPTNTDGWQAGTCLTDEPVSGEPKIHCGPQTGPAFFKTAAGHPPIGFTQYFIQHEAFSPLPSPPFPAGSVLAPIQEPLADRTIDTLRVDLPPGLTVNPNAAPKCSLADFERVVELGGKKLHVPNCSEASAVGREEVTLVTNVAGYEPEPGKPLPKGFVIPPSESSGTKIPVYNLTPNEGEPALFGFVVAGEEIVFLKTEVAWDSDFHESFTIKLPGPEPPFSTLISRLINFGATTGNGTYINNPTTCFDPNAYPQLYSTWYRAHSYGEPDPNFPFGSTPFEAKVEETSGGVGKLVQQEGCATVPFDPGIDVSPGTDQVDSPAHPTVDTTLKYYTGKESTQQESHLRKAEVKLPAGMGINPAAADGLLACSDAQFKKGVRTYDNECPGDSKIGSAEITSPPLERPLTGDIYIGEQKSSDPTSGEEFRILVEAKEPKEGIDVRLVGKTSADPVTGQLTASFDEQQVGPLAGDLPSGLPQAPFESVKLRFDGAKAVLSSPPTCADAETVGKMEPWSWPEAKTVSSKFTLSSIPGGGSCPTTMADRPFAPSYEAVPNRAKAGGYSPLIVDLLRHDGEQELKKVDVTLPEGLTGKLAGLQYCPDYAIEQAAQRSGTSVIAEPACQNKSYIGAVYTALGTGSKPLTVAGNGYLAGPYKGAPLSMAIITGAVAGPFDLGTVVVRVALNIDPITAQVHAVSDTIPDVFGGVKLDIRAIDLRLNRKKFMLNPTNCQKVASEGSLSGGGGNPVDPSAWSSYSFSAPFQAKQCGKLGFKPQLHVRISGPTTRAKNPQLRAVLVARKGDSNIARTALNLPHSLFLDQSHIRTVCTRPKLAARECPKSAIYGHAKAKTPLLNHMLKGPVYMVPSGHELPDLVADLRGQVNIQLHGVISGKHGGLKSVFSSPDVPVSKFILNMASGKKSLLVNSTNTCKTRQYAILNMKAHNGRREKDNRFPLNIASCHKGKKK